MFEFSNSIAEKQAGIGGVPVQVSEPANEGADYEKLLRSVSTKLGNITEYVH